MLKLSESSDISQFGLTFTNLAEITAHTHDYEYLVDVIGLMMGISAEQEYTRDGKITKMFIIELTDHRFRVKLEVSDGRSTCVFVLFDSEMSYMM
ncbi:replication factor A protein [Trifolium repens]|nr:replication factor A protein [Trifolium repens]